MILNSLCKSDIKYLFKWASVVHVSNISNIWLSNPISLVLKCTFLTKYIFNFVCTTRRLVAMQRDGASPLVGIFQKVDIFYNSCYKII